METRYSREELIDLYLFGKLSPQKQKAFEDEMSKDDDLRKEIENTRRIIMGFERRGESEAIYALQNVSEKEVKSIIDNAENSRKQPAKKIGLYAAMTGVAATIALLLYIGFQPEYSSQELHNSFYTSFEYEYTPSRAGILSNDKEQLLQQGIDEYNRRNYFGALVLFDKITIDMEPEQVPEEITFYSALCLAQTGKENTALEKLESIASSNDSQFQDDALWNLALTYLKMGERNKCRDMLRGIADSKNSPYANDANRLLDKLKTRRWF